MESRLGEPLLRCRHPMTIRFVHTADWQIGKTFGQMPAEAREDLRSQRIRTVQRIAELARDRDADAVLVAGDAFDSNEVSDRTLVRTLDALTSYAGPWIFLPGNHDPALVHSVWTRLRALGAPANVVIADTPVVIDRWRGAAVVLPAPLRRRSEALDQTEWFDGAPSPDGALRVGLAHGSVAGRLPGDDGAATNEIPGDRARRAGLGYLALGDWHGAMRVADRSWYSGTPETDRHRDNDSGNVHVVDLDGAGAPERVQTVRVGHFGWVKREIEILEGTCDAVFETLGALPHEPRRSVVSLALKGAIGLAERRRMEEELSAWQARVHHLSVDDAELRDEPTADDFDAIDSSGFVRLAIERLRSKADNPADPQSQDARIALRMVYLDHAAKSA